MDFEEIKNIPPEYKNLIKTFCTNYHTINSLIDKGDLNSAQPYYLDMVSAYSKIAASPIHQIHKRIAHDALTKTYDHINNETQQILPKTSIRFMIALSILVIILLAGIMLKPNMIGLASIELTGNAPVWTTEHRSLTIHGITTLNLDTLFTNPSGHKLTYLATNGKHTNTSLYQQYLSLIPQPAYYGTDSISIIASDQEQPSSYTKIPITLSITPPIE